MAVDIYIVQKNFKEIHILILNMWVESGTCDEIYKSIHWTWMFKNVVDREA